MTVRINNIKPHALRPPAHTRTCSPLGVINKSNADIIATNFYNENIYAF